ncbi:MAG: FG-GAP-like repeat-containing protein [Polyangiales bacterium]
MACCRSLSALLLLGACFDPTRVNGDGAATDVAAFDAGASTGPDASGEEDAGALDVPAAQDVVRVDDTAAAPIDVAAPPPDAPADPDVPVARDATVDRPATPRDAALNDVPTTAIDVPTPPIDVPVSPRDVASIDVPAPPLDAPVAPPDLPVADVPRDVPRDAPRDAGPPPATCTAGRGSAVVAAPRRTLALRDMGQEGWLGSPAIVDLDGDGAREVVATRGARVAVWRRDGTLQWSRAPGTARVWAGAVVGDFAGSSALEVAVAAGARVALYDVAGNAAAGFPVSLRDEVRALAAGDLDADGRPELVAASTVTAGAGAREDLLTAFRGNGAVVAGYPPNGTGTSRCDSACDIAGAFDQNLAVGPIDGDARADILAPMDNAYAAWHRGAGEAFPVSSIFQRVTRSPGVRFIVDYAEAQQGYAMNESTAEQAHFTNTAPALVDLDGDGARELVMLSSIQNVSQTNRRRGVALWAVRPDGTRPAAWVTPYRAATYLAGLNDLGGNIVAATNSVAVADVDARAAGPELLFAAFDGNIHCVGADRSARWTYPFTTAATVLTAGVAVADLSDDGVPEVIFATYSTQQNTSALFVLNASGALLHRVALPGRGAMAVPTVGDLDGDGTLEIVVSLKDAASDGAEVLVFNVAASGTRCLPWPTGRGNYLRNGSP